MQSRNRRSPSMTISRRRRVALAYTSFSWGSCKQSCCIRCLAQRSHPTWKMTFRMRRHGATDSSSSSVPTSLRCRRGPTPTGGSTPPRKFVRRGGHSLNRRNGFARRVHRNHPVLPRQDSTGIRLGSPTPNVVQIGNFLTRQFIRKMTPKCRHHQLPKYYP